MCTDDLKIYTISSISIIKLKATKSAKKLTLRHYSLHKFNVLWTLVKHGPRNFSTFLHLGTQNSTLMRDSSLMNFLREARLLRLFCAAAASEAVALTVMLSTTIPMRLLSQSPNSSANKAMFSSRHRIYSSQSAFRQKLTINLHCLCRVAVPRPLVCSNRIPNDPCQTSWIAF